MLIERKQQYNKGENVKYHVIAYKGKVHWIASTKGYSNAVRIIQSMRMSSKSHSKQFYCLDR